MICGMVPFSTTINYPLTQFSRVRNYSTDVEYLRNGTRCTPVEDFKRDWGA